MASQPKASFAKVLASGRLIPNSYSEQRSDQSSHSNSLDPAPASTLKPTSLDDSSPRLGTRDKHPQPSGSDPDILCSALKSLSVGNTRDNESVISTNTFALDERESLRPDDSASVCALQDACASAKAGGTSPGTSQTNQYHTSGDEQSNNTSSLPQEAPDERILESLHSQRDRVWVLQLEQDVLNFIKNSDDGHLELPQCNSFYRMLAHRLADYYNLGHSVDNTGHAVVLYKTPNHTLPPALSTLVAPPEPSTKITATVPARIIMRRSGANTGSASGTTVSSVSPSKSPSDAGVDSSSDTGLSFESKPKTSLSREEREAKYREVRQRIFGDSEPAAPGLDCVKSSISRTSSTNGKKKFRKPKRFDQDGFDPRFSQYPPPAPGMPAAYYGGVGYGNGGSGVGAYVPPPHPMAQYGGNLSGAPYGSFPPPHPPPDSQQMYPGYGQAEWGMPMDQAMPYPGHYNYPPTYDPSMDYQRGMQPFQTGPPVDSALPPSVPLPASQQYPPQYPPPWPTPSMNPGGPLAVPGGAVPPPMNYSNYNQQHWLGATPPRSYNGPPMNQLGFNPQCQSYVPVGGRSTPKSSVNTTPVKPFNRRPNCRVEDSNSQRAFGSPSSNSHRSPTGSAIFPRSMALVSPGGSISQRPSSIPSGPTSASSIAKWGVPSHLPPRPPLPANMEPAKFLEAHRDYAPRGMSGGNVNASLPLPSAKNTVPPKVNAEALSENYFSSLAAPNCSVLSVARRSPTSASVTLPVSGNSDVTTPVPRPHRPLANKIVFGALDAAEIGSE